MNWVEKQVRRTGLKRLIWATLIVAILVFAAMASSRYLSNFFSGAQTITKEDLDQMHNVEDLKHYWVKIDADDLINTQFQEITIHTNHGIETSRSVTATYYLARIGDRLLTVKMRDGAQMHALNGALVRRSGNVDDEFFNSAAARAHKDEIYPSMVLDTGDFRTDGEIWMTIGAAVLALAAWLAWTGLSWMIRPQEHKLVTLLQSWGDAGKISERLEQELRSSQAIKLGNTVFTPNFVVQRSSYNFKLLRTDQLIWVYQRITKQKTYFITTGKTHALSVNTDKESLLINGKEKVIAQVLQQLAAHRPWVIFGYSDELKKFYSSKRAQMVADVNARKQKAQAGAKAA